MPAPNQHVLPQSLEQQARSLLESMLQAYEPGETKLNSTELILFLLMLHRWRRRERVQCIGLRLLTRVPSELDLWEQEARQGHLVFRQHIRSSGTQPARPPPRERERERLGRQVFAHGPLEDVIFALGCACALGARNNSALVCARDVQCWILLYQFIRCVTSFYEGDELQNQKLILEWRDSCPEQCMRTYCSSTRTNGMGVGMALFLN